MNSISACRGGGKDCKGVDYWAEGRQGSRQTGREADRQTGKQTGRQAYREACRQTGIQGSRQAGVHASTFNRKGSFVIDWR